MFPSLVLIGPGPGPAELSLLFRRHILDSEDHRSQLTNAVKMPRLGLEVKTVLGVHTLKDPSISKTLQ